MNSFEVSAMDAKFPLRITDVDFDSKHIILNEVIDSKIEKTVKDYYETDCLKDSLHSYKDIYLTTIRLCDSLQTVYLILLKHYPTEMIHSKVLFYDNQNKRFADKVLDFNLHALYDFDNGKLKPTNLKNNFRITSPEIERIDFNKDGMSDYKFTRLFHNGTFNAIHTAVLTSKNFKLDTLSFKEESLGDRAVK